MSSGSKAIHVEPVRASQIEAMDEQMIKDTSDQPDTPAKLAIKAHEDEDSRIQLQGIHSLTHSVTDEVISTPTSEVDDDEDDPDYDQTEDVSSDEKSEKRLNALEDRDLAPRMQPGDEDEGETNSESAHQHSEINGPTSCLEEKQSGEEDDQELSELQSGPMEANFDLGDVYHPQRSDSQEIDRPVAESENVVESYASEICVVSYPEKLGLETLDRDVYLEELGLDAVVSVFCPQQLEPDDEINPFTLEDRIRKAREDQDYVLEWEANNLVDGRFLDSSIEELQQLSSEDLSGSIPELEEIYRQQARNSAYEAFDRPDVVSQFKQRRRREAIPEERAEDKLLTKRTGAGEAVFVGALASGVNRPTWFVIRAVLVALVASLVLLLHVAFQSASVFILLNVLVLVAIAGGLIFLLTWYISEVGLVSVEKQMAELNLIDEQRETESKTL